MWPLASSTILSSEIKSRSLSLGQVVVRGAYSRGQVTDARFLFPAASVGIVGKGAILRFYLQARLSSPVPERLRRRVYVPL